MKDQELIRIGKITKHQGNRGEIRVYPLTDTPERFEFLEEVYLLKGNHVEKKRIEAYRFHKNFVILKLEGINDINAAQELRDYEVCILEEDLLPLADNEYYIDDLIGFTVYTQEGEFLGEISEVIVTGGTDVFVVKGEEKDYLIPAAFELITEVNELEKKMLVDPIPGLLEL
ncbi:MAG TPA: 16S rRNA processing protein RimM [Halanaerobiaceae bacterium]|jgi:16S rRNA processing protein RimM|nr:ribosome maturation factor RimM [Bacillota bacterium]HHU93285.1 16S rRNA processing protein RimM [Halanaerobiaceae bacterium]HOA40294.1 ribosome maturation factor RimM [Halanaerobiales bacterium]HPZ62338.1 ribosome maturation factor RimM [Halanaerobiales bacterium]HQD03186.1 ribosome maturation factor RimM [Halanaerobiales bacterium]